MIRYLKESFWFLQSDMNQETKIIKTHTIRNFSQAIHKLGSMRLELFQKSTLTTNMKTMEFINQ